MSGTIAEQTSLSSDINVLTAEINAYKRIAGEAIFEIGRRLKLIKESDLARGQYLDWLKTVDIAPRTAQSMVQAYEQFGKAQTSAYSLPVGKIFEMLSLPSDIDRAEFVSAQHTIPSTGETKTVESMTVRELREVKAALRRAEEERKAAEQRAEKAEADYEVVRDTLESIRDRPPNIEYAFVAREDNDPLRVTSEIRIDGNIQRLSETVGRLISDYGYFAYYDRQISDLNRGSRKELETIVDAIEKFISPIRRALSGNTIIIDQEAV